MRTWIGLFGVTLVTLATTASLVACGSSASGDSGPSGPATRACSPLDGPTPAIALAEVVAVGRHPDGTLYVVDQDTTQLRLFVSRGSVLQRATVLGSGETGAGGSIIATFDVDGTSTTATIAGPPDAPIPSRLTVGQVSNPLTPLGRDAPAALAGVTFLCF